MLPQEGSGRKEAAQRDGEEGVRDGRMTCERRHNEVTRHKEAVHRRNGGREGRARSLANVAAYATEGIREGGGRGGNQRS